MNIILDVLKELNFVLKDTFFIEYEINDNNSVTVDMLVSSENDSQVFLLINCDNKYLNKMLDGLLIKEMALRFRKNKYHKAEMDRNTALLIISKYLKNEDIDTASKVKIEDDPYFFKKYVFSYDDIELEKANNWMSENDQRGTAVSLIQECITDTEQFAEYKLNRKNNPVYSFFIELVTKIHCFPMKTVGTKNIKSIDSFLTEQLSELRNDKKNPIDINQESIESFLDMDIDYGNVNDICSKWDEVFGSVSEDKI